jgi:flagellar biosynthesis protein FlhB
VSSEDAGESDDKTEEPTDRRREQAREQGQIAKSVDLTAAAVLMAAAGGLSLLGPEAGGTLLRMLETVLSADARVTLSRDEAVQWMQSLAIMIGAAFLPLMALTMLGSLSANLLQVGFLWSTEALQPNFARINPLSGFQRLFSLASVIRLGGSIAKILLVATVGYLFLMTRQTELFALSQQEASVILSTGGRMVVELGFYLALTLISLAILDYGYQYWQHERDLRMTKKELRDEMKEMDGNPHVRARRREAHRKLTEARELSQVKNADVVITNPTHIAVAVKYDAATMAAPVVVAKGMGEIAQQIRRIAAEHGIPIIERKPLARALYKDVKVGRQIPVELYEVFVEILAYVYRLSGKKPPTMV